MARLLLSEKRAALCSYTILGASVPTLHLGGAAALTAILVLPARDPGGAIPVDAGNSPGLPKATLFGPALRVSPVVADIRIAVFLARREQIGDICSAAAPSRGCPGRHFACRKRTGRQARACRERRSALSGFPTRLGASRSPGFWTCEISDSRVEFRVDDPAGSGAGRLVSRIAESTLRGCLRDGNGRDCR